MSVLICCIVLSHRVAAAHERNLHLVIVCPPFETGNKCFSPPTVEVLAGLEELELTWAQASNFEFTVMDIKKTISPKPLKVEVPSVTLLGHYPLTGSDSSCDDIIFDSTARGHIFGKREFLEDFQEYATPKMARLPDGTNVPILGSGNIKTVTFDIPDVEFAPDLKVNVVSMNQLDRDHGLFCDFHGKTLEIRKDDQTVVGAGVRKNDGIYVLQNLHVPEEPQM
ncbi:hypothetical protein HU200_014331 [Digitaria exilis]|uniref:Retrovirus-related Pol polyprotein from transposon TNT 1-94-like beta-barrel domain-containing protein n=1 Tax=Digitaria exilis TaxID=1010633 RepID=A0A835FC29_9POAL|nr:hypothetical protein HU200_014331 [Digitaria exilis]